MKTVLSFFLVYFGWGSLYFAIRLAVQSIPPFLLAGTSSLVAGFLLYGISSMSGASRPSRAQWKASLVVALAMLVIGNGCVVWAEQTVPSAVTALILATEPAWLALLAWIFFKEKRPGRGVFAGMAAGFVGVGLLVGDGLSGAQAFPLFDALLILAAAVAWSWGSLFCRSADLPQGSFFSIAMPLILGGAILSFIGLGAGELGRLDISSLPREAIYSFLYITFVSYGATYAAYFWLLKNISVAKVSTYAYVNPLVALALGVWLAHEPFTRMMLAGGMAILVSVVLVLKYSTSNPRENT